MGRTLASGWSLTLYPPQASRAQCVSATWMTARQTLATTGAVWTASPVSHAPVPRATPACAVKARWMSAEASPADTEANA